MFSLCKWSGASVAALRLIFHADLRVIRLYAALECNFKVDLSSAALVFIINDDRVACARLLHAREKPSAQL